MKFKFKYFKKYKIYLKKIISNGLAVGLLFNTTTPSMASVLSDDNRYELFEGSNITINDILEENEPQVEIEGDTLFNIIGNQGKDIYTHDNSDYTRKRLFKCKNLKPNTTYTFKTTISNITSTDTSDLKVHYENILEDGTSKEIFPVNFKQKLSEGRIEIVFTTKDVTSTKTSLYLYIDSMNAQYGTPHQFSFESSECILVEGDYSNDNIPYFEGIKSVGEIEGNIKINASNKNLFDTSKLYVENYNGINDEADYYVADDSIFMSKKSESGNFVGTKVKCTKGKTYRFGFAVGENSDYSSLTMFIYSDKAWGNRIATLTNKTNDLMSETFIATTDEVFVGCYMHGAGEIGKVFEFKDVFVSEEHFSDYEKPQNSSQEILLNEPLRGIKDGVKDRIIKKNGQWVIERNCAEITIDTSSVYMYREQIWDDYYGVMININKKLGMKLGRLSGVNYYYDDFIAYPNCWNIGINYSANKQNMYCISPKPDEYMNLFSKIPKAEVDLYSGTNEEKIKQWFKDNCDKLNIVYQLETPIYEPIKFNSFNLYLNTTYIYSDTLISPKIKIIVDRVANRAKESILIAESNPTIENISKARMWSNLMSESILKDVFLEAINDVTDIKDLQIEKKTVTYNIDVYIKSQNSLSISLSTNSILFDEFSGVEDLEKLNAVDITISSSLPYRLNSYLESELKNADGSKIIPKELFNIRLNRENDYKAFTNINEKLVLKDDCEKGNDNIFSIDLILKGSLMHKADVYKTVIKFEAEQK